MESLDKFLSGFHKSDGINGAEEAVGVYASPTGSVSASGELLLPLGCDVA